MGVFNENTRFAGGCHTAVVVGYGGGFYALLLLTMSQCMVVVLE